MKINLEDKYLVETDGLNAVIKKKFIVTKKVEEGEEPQTEEVFKPIGYYSTIKQALLYVLNIELLTDTTMESIEEVVSKIEYYTELIENLKI